MGNDCDRVEKREQRQGHSLKGCCCTWAKTQVQSEDNGREGRDQWMALSDI